MARSVVLVWLVAAGCGRRHSEETGSSPPPSSKTAKAPATVAEACAKGKAKGPLQWFEDDYAAAVGCAQAKNVPIVLDLWAPWCHTCLSMQTTVFMDPSMAKIADQYVFAALDTDRETNAGAVRLFSNSAWPTFYVIAPDEKVLARFVGAATLEQFQDFMAAGTKAAAGGAPAGDARLLGAERALAIRDLKTADEELTAALAAAPATWPRRFEALGSLQLTQYKEEKYTECLGLSEQHMDDIGQSAIATNFWATAVNCADKLKAEQPDRAAAIVSKATALLRRVLDDPNAPLSVDDRGEALGYLRDALEGAGKKDDATKVAEELRLHEDKAWAAATTPIGRMTYLWPRAEAYAYLNRSLELVPDVEKLAAELPDEYEPRARLGWLYLKASKLNEAARWTDEALSRVYGPRKGRILTQRADIAKAIGDRMLERKYRDLAVKLYESLPDGQRSPENLRKAKEALEAVDAGSATTK